VQVPHGLPEQADRDHQDDGGGEQVGGRRERLAGLADAAQVAVAHDEHDAHGDFLRIGPEHRDRRHDGRGPARDLHRDGDHVVDEQRHGGDLGDPRAEVLPGDHV